MGCAASLRLWPQRLTSLRLNQGPGREFYELRLYHLRRGPKQKLFDDFCRNAAIPALNRAAVAPVGVFSVMTGPDSPTMYVLRPFKSPEAFASVEARLAADAEY